MLQSLSPEQTSDWCDSLAPCGIRGELLASVKSAIEKRRVDGKQFDDLLRSNALKNLGVEDLNPRLAVAVRKAWNKDFSQISFIAHSDTTRPPAIQRTQPPSSEMRTRSAEKRAALASAAAAAAANPSRGPCKVKSPGACGFYDQGLGDMLPSQASAPRSYAPPQPRGSRASVGGVGDRAGVATNAGYESSRSLGQQHSHGHGDVAGQGLGDIFQPKVGPAPHSYAPPQPRQCGGGGGGNGGGCCGPPAPFDPRCCGGPGSTQEQSNFEDVFRKQGPPPTSFAAPQPRGGRSRNSPASAGTAPKDVSGESHSSHLHDIFAPRPKAASSYASPSGQPSSNDYRDGGRAGQLGNTSRTATPTRSNIGSPGSCGPAPPGFSHGSGSPCGGDQFCGGVQQTSSAPASPAPLPSGGGKPGGGGGGASGWDGVGLGDALGAPRPAQLGGRQRYGADEAPASGPPSGRGGRRHKHGAGMGTQEDPWAGVSLGDAMSKKPPAATRYGAAAEQQQQQQESTPSGGRNRRSPVAADGWEGVSLGDALSRRPPANHDNAAGADGDGVATSAGHYERGGGGGRGTCGGDSGGGLAASVVADPWAGVELGGAPQKRGAATAQNGDDGGCTSSRGIAAPVPPKSASGPADPWAGVQLGGAPPKAATATRPPPEPRPSKRGGGGGGGGGGSSDKSPGEIVEWLRSLPISHVPEASREQLVELVEAQGYDGGSFTDYVKTVPPEVCAPKHAIKLRNAWSNVLQEAEHKKICEQNLKENVGKKAVAISC
eukprot:TRINITY_DN7389_c0_g2_i1.p1 TRINITY_DN7389_c0_g2~~TRINITY_DN7389_c0_g2_i1.p1  ORF type:complete len:772 (-),score=150.19 TRINITY_DN7389_c0_g2_i1:73-2388(-)